MSKWIDFIMTPDNKKAILLYLVLFVPNFVLFLANFSIVSFAASSTNTLLLNPNRNIMTIANPSPTPVMMDAGTYNFDGTSSTWVGSFSTNRLCLSGYSPYFLFVPDITWNGDGGSAFMVTYSSMSTNTSNYTVKFNKQYGQDSGGIAFTWVMFCYPPSISVPGYLPYGGDF